jgi:hypothetical protein
MVRVDELHPGEERLRPSRELDQAAKRSAISLARAFPGDSYTS